MKRLLPVLLLSATLLSAQGVVSGDWTISGDVQGYEINETCTLVQTDMKIAGSCLAQGKKWDTTGGIDGKTITLKHGGEYNGDSLTLTFTGIAGEDGNFSGAIDVQPMNVGGSFTAKKAIAK